MRAKGSARSATTSIPPAGATRSRRASTCAWILGRSPSTARGVNARLTASRRRVWCGRIPEEHRLPVATGLEADAHAVSIRARVRPEVPLEPFAPEPRVAEDRRHVRVARENPQAAGRAVDGLALAEQAVEAVRIGAAGGADGVEDVGRRIRRLRGPARVARHARSRRATAVPGRPAARATPQTCCGDARLRNRGARPAVPVIPLRIRHLSAAERIRGGLVVDSCPHVCRRGRSSRGDANRARDHASGTAVLHTAAGTLAALARLLPYSRNHEGQRSTA